MAIVNMTNVPVLPEGAVNLKGHDHVANRDTSNDVIGPCPYWTYETFNGKCLVERERNMHDDSDFFMLVWNDETNSPQEIMFASTRGWSYPCLASRVDATEEVKAKYAAWLVVERTKLVKAQRNTKAKKLVNLRNDLRAIAEKWNVDYCKLLRLRHKPQFEQMISLFNIRIRSNFKISMRNQLISWLNGQSKYSNPFSPKQIQCL